MKTAPAQVKQMTRPRTDPNPIPYEDHFKISREDFEKILETALSRGGDFAEVFLEYQIYEFINMEDEIIKETAETVSLGMGIRVLSGDRTGYGYTSDLSPGMIQKAALTAGSVAVSGGRGRAKRAASGSVERGGPRLNLYPVLRPAHAASMKAKIGLVREAYLAAQHFDPTVKKVKASYQGSLKHISIVNSDGVDVRDVRPQIRLVCVAIAEKGGERESGYCGGGGRVGLEYFRTRLTPRQIGEEAAREAVNLLEAIDAPAGEMPIVLSPGHSGVLIHEAVGHLLEADFNRKKTSVFWNKMGKKIGSEMVTIYDDPTIPSSRGSYNIDDEGTRPRKTLLVEKGVVRGWLQDRLSAGLMKLPLTGHGRRQDYACWPLPRMSNTYIEKGEYAAEEIIKSVQKGFYVDRLQGGQVEDSGKFTFSVSSGFLIEGGRLTAPVKQATLIGTNVDILKKIEMVGGDLEFGLQTGTCSKEGQDVPVNDGCPTMKISKMTVGGRE